MRDQVNRPLAPAQAEHVRRGGREDECAGKVFRCPSGRKNCNVETMQMPAREAEQAMEVGDAPTVGWAR